MQPHLQSQANAVRKGNRVLKCSGGVQYSSIIQHTEIIPPVLSQFERPGFYRFKFEEKLSKYESDKIAGRNRVSSPLGVY